MLSTIGYSSYLSTGIASLGKYLSSAVALILYTNTDNNFVYDTDGSGNAVLTNQGSSSTTNDGLLNTGRGLELGATNDLAIPIHYTWDTVNLQNSFNSTAAWSDEIGTYSRPSPYDTFLLAVTTVGTNTNRPRVTLNMTESPVIGQSYKFTFNAVVTSGIPIITSGEVMGYSFSDYTVVDGVNTIIGTATATTSTSTFDFDGTQLFDLTVSDAEIVLADTANSYITYYDFSTSQFIEVDNSLNPPSTTYTFSNQTVNNILTHTTALSTADSTALNANPQLMAKLAMSGTGTISELDLVLIASDEWYACSEPTLATVYDARGTNTETITNYAETIRTNADFQTKGLQTTCLVLDGVGVPTAYDDGLLQWHGNGFADAQFMPPGDSAWEIDFVMECKNDSTFKVSGANSTTTANALLFGQHSSGGLYVDVGALKGIGSETTIVSDGLHHIRIEYDGVGNGNFVVDNTTIYPYLSSGYVYSANESLFIGALSRTGVYYVSGGEHKKPTGYFQYVTKERTTAERDADYAKAKAMHPTLP